MTRLDTRLAVADALATARENMRQSAAKARQGTSRREIIERLLAATPPVPRALPAPAGVTIAPVAPALIDLTGVAPFTERALATTTGISLAQIAKAVTAKKIRVCRRRGGRRHHRSGRQDSHHRALCGHERHGGGPIPV